MLYDLRVSAVAVQRVADWMLSTGAGGADIELRRDGDVLVCEQGDDRAAWDMEGHARPAEATCDPRGGVLVRTFRSGAHALVRWYCSATCAAAEPDKQGVAAHAPAIVPNGRRCSRCNRRLVQHG